jgi:hypothetical protein
MKNVKVKMGEAASELFHFAFYIFHFAFPLSPPPARL